ncbi:hypothetical protein CspHIS471_0303030 [Cutaneotrichosporon sp. HIS471]|nr:hypothetical protein CspHIS471_0303030 [Cutaneotrichosporon sp. HIS471]
MFAHLLTALFLAALLVNNVLAVVEYNVTMRSTAAILSYEPFNTTLDAGWNETYSLASWGEYNTGAMPDGDNAHVTSHIGATVSVSYPPKSPFTDAAAAPLSPATPIQMYPPSPLKGPAMPPPRPNIVTQAEDGGRVVEEQVPPRYNPAWADDGPGGR